MIFECPVQESHSKFSVTNQKDEGLWEDPSNAGPKTWEADDIYDDGDK